METGIELEKSEKKGYNPLMIILLCLVVFETIRVVYLSNKKKKTIGSVLKDDAKLLSTPTAVVAIMGFVTGVMEFIIVNNVNQYGFPDSFKGGKIVTIPPKDELIKTSTTILIVSIITGFLTDITLKMVSGKKEEDLASKMMN
jgi:hypothetical protein